MFGRRHAVAPGLLERVAALETDLKATRRDVADLEERWASWRKSRMARPDAEPVQEVAAPAYLTKRDVRRMFAQRRNGG